MPERSVSRELLERDPKGLSRLLIAKVLNSLADRVDAGGKLTRHQQDFLLKAYCALEEGELTEAELEERVETKTLEDLKQSELRRLFDKLSEQN